jgi:5-methylcytosine-specific restriction endonuclease McrBC regulatory subunit McrC
MMADIYQMFAYGAKSKAQGMILLYPIYNDRYN